MPFFPSSDGGTEAEKEITSWVKLRQASLMVKCQPLPAADHENPKPITATSRLPGGKIIDKLGLSCAKLSLASAKLHTSKLRQA